MGLCDDVTTVLFEVFVVSTVKKKLFELTTWRYAC